MLLLGFATAIEKPSASGHSLAQVDAQAETKRWDGNPFGFNSSKQNINDIVSSTMNSNGSGYSSGGCDFCSGSCTPIDVDHQCCGKCNSGDSKNDCSDNSISEKNSFKVKGTMDSKVTFGNNLLKNNCYCWGGPCSCNGCGDGGCSCNCSCDCNCDGGCNNDKCKNCKDDCKQKCKGDKDKCKKRCDKCKGDCASDCNKCKKDCKKNCGKDCKNCKSKCQANCATDCKKCRGDCLTKCYKDEQKKCTKKCTGTGSGEPYGKCVSAAAKKRNQCNKACKATFPKKSHELASCINDCTEDWKPLKEECDKQRDNCQKECEAKIPAKCKIQCAGQCDSTCKNCDKKCDTKCKDRCDCGNKCEKDCKGRCNCNKKCKKDCKNCDKDCDKKCDEDCKDDCKDEDDKDDCKCKDDKEPCAGGESPCKVCNAVDWKKKLANLRH